MSHTVQDFPVEFFKLRSDATVEKVTIRARQLRPCKDDVTGLPWWLSFLQWPLFLYIVQELYNDLRISQYSRILLARFLHVDVVVTLQHEKLGEVEVNFGKSAPGIYRRPVDNCNMLNIWSKEVPTRSTFCPTQKKLIDTKMTLNELIDFMEKIKRPYHVKKDNCICFTWELCKAIFVDLDLDFMKWRVYTDFWDFIAREFMREENRLNCK